MAVWPLLALDPQAGEPPRRPVAGAEALQRVVDVVGARRGEGAQAAARDPEDGLVGGAGHPEGGERGPVAAERDDEVAVGRGRGSGAISRSCPGVRTCADLDPVGGRPGADGRQRAVDRPAGVHDEADPLHLRRTVPDASGGPRPTRASGLSRTGPVPLVAPTRSTR